MITLLRHIGVAMLLLLGWLLMGNLLAAEHSDADAPAWEVPVWSACSYAGQGQAFIGISALPGLPDAELLGGAGQWQPSPVWRERRIAFTDGGSSLRALLNATVRRVSLGAGCQEGRFDKAVSHSFHRRAEYYVFALRKILI